MNIGLSTYSSFRYSHFKLLSLSFMDNTFIQNISIKYSTVYFLIKLLFTFLMLCMKLSCSQKTDENCEKLKIAFKNSKDLRTIIISLAYFFFKGKVNCFSVTVENKLRDIYMESYNALM